MAEEALEVVAVEIEEEAEVGEALIEEETVAIEARAALEAAMPDLETGHVPSQSVATPTSPGETSATSARILKKFAWEGKEVAAAEVDMATEETGGDEEDMGEAATEMTEALEEIEEEVEEDTEAAMTEEEAEEASEVEEIEMIGEGVVLEAEGAEEIGVAEALEEIDAAEAEDLAGAGTDVVGVPWGGEAAVTGIGLTNNTNHEGQCRLNG